MPLSEAHPDLDRRPAEPPSPWAEVEALLRAAPDPEAVLAAEILRRADPSGFIPDRDADLARDLRLPEAACQTA